MADAPRGILKRRRTWVAAFLVVLVGSVVWLAYQVPDEAYVAGVLSRVLGRPTSVETFEIHRAYADECVASSAVARASIRSGADGP